MQKTFARNYTQMHIGHEIVWKVLQSKKLIIKGATDESENRISENLGKLLQNTITFMKWNNQYYFWHLSQ
jgi:hypothetical protein